MWQLFRNGKSAAIKSADLQFWVCDIRPKLKVYKSLIVPQLQTLKLYCVQPKKYSDKSL